MYEDITDILQDWEYDSDNLVRIIKADDGREILQVRQPLGIEQYELDGRPDGIMPYDKESFLHVYQDIIEDYKLKNRTDKGFKLDYEEFINLENECIIYYYRYMILFQTGDFERTVRDTEHNLNLYNIIEKYVENKKDKKEILQYKPFSLRINAISRAMISLQQELKLTAIKIIESAIEMIINMPNIETPTFKFEKIRSIHSLQTTLKQIMENKSSPIENLKINLQKAVELEDYEKAAELRDKIKDLEK